MDSNLNLLKSYYSSKAIGLKKFVSFKRTYKYTCVICNIYLSFRDVISLPCYLLF